MHASYMEIIDILRHVQSVAVALSYTLPSEPKPLNNEEMLARYQLFQATMHKIFEDIFKKFGQLTKQLQQEIDKPIEPLKTFESSFLDGNTFSEQSLVEKEDNLSTLTDALNKIHQLESSVGGSKNDMINRLLSIQGKAKQTEKAIIDLIRVKRKKVHHPIMKGPGKKYKIILSKFSSHDYTECITWEQQIDIMKKHHEKLKDFVTETKGHFEVLQQALERTINHWKGCIAWRRDFVQLAASYKLMIQNANNSPTLAGSKRKRKDADFDEVHNISPTASEQSFFIEAAQGVKRARLAPKVSVLVSEPPKCNVLVPGLNILMPA